MKNLSLLIASLFLGFSAQALKPISSLKLDPEQSKAVWTGKKIGGSHTGTVKFKSGHFEMKKGALVSGEVLVDMQSLNCTDLKDPDLKAKLEKHLKSEDFFNVEKYPTAEFKFTRFEEMKTFAPGGPNAIAYGKLTVRGVTQAVEMRFVYTPTDIGFIAKGKLEIDRTQYGLKYNSKKFYDLKALGDKLIEDQFEVELNLTVNRDLKTKS